MSGDEKKDEETTGTYRLGKVRRKEHLIATESVDGEPENDKVK